MKYSMLIVRLVTFSLSVNLQYFSCENKDSLQTFYIFLINFAKEKRI